MKGARVMFGIIVVGDTKSPYYICGTTKTGWPIIIYFPDNPFVK